MTRMESDSEREREIEKQRERERDGGEGKIRGRVYFQRRENFSQKSRVPLYFFLPS